jgi:hypothetical protein
MNPAVNRRDLLTGVAAVAGAAVLPRIELGVEPLRLAAVVVDRRYPELRQFHETLQGSAARVIDAADLCRHWYGDNMVEAGMAIAGLTTWIDFIVMRGCARETGLPTTLIGDHASVSAEAIAHTCVQSLCGDPGLASEVWPASVASWVKSGLWRRAGSLRRQTVPGRNVSGRLMHWVSWVIAEPGRAFTAE